MITDAQYLELCRRQTLRGADQSAAATAAMAGIDVAGEGRRCSAHAALEHAWLASRGETACQPHGLVAALAERNANAVSKLVTEYLATHEITKCKSRGGRSRQLRLGRRSQKARGARRR